MTDNLRVKISKALAGTRKMSLRESAKNFLKTLGYDSRRTVDAGNVQEFLQNFRPEKPLTEKQRVLFHEWVKVEIVFQITEDEIKIQALQRDFDGVNFEKGRISSFLFLAADMKSKTYSRAHLAETTRVVNRLFQMPVIVLFRYDSKLTLSVVHRRASKREDDRDVLEKVTLIKDILVDNPHRAHIDILTDLALENMIIRGVRSFDSLHEKWEKILDVEALNKRFYNKLFDWFEWASKECNFPDDSGGKGCIQRHVIRLITRILFVWFLKEKGLVSDELLKEEFAREQIKNYEPGSTAYYQAVLQNLFFSTLNTEIDKRNFSKGISQSHAEFSSYRYRNLLQDPDGFVKKLKKVPFVNGGLFDCLDDFSAEGEGKWIDVFAENIDNKHQNLHVPAKLFFHDQDGLFSLLRLYKFTIEESTPLDTEVALDPELIGRVFENLLAAYNPETRDTARKCTGSYYTPRQIVDYMVREALAETLASKSVSADGDTNFWRARLHYLLDHSDAMNDANELFREEEKRSIVEAIANIRTLDPAVGSGAFPMGILQTLTMALRRLDPDNLLWEEFQKERAATSAEQAFDIENQQKRDNELAEISATFENYRKSDFGRKLYLIQNCIYGVDIQPIACQIAKLRFFISLVIEQHSDPAAPNLGIRPLPNLETRLVAAESLIKPKNFLQDYDLYQGEDLYSKKRDQIRDVRERYFLANSRQKKLECMQNDERLRGQLRDIIETEHQNEIARRKQDIEKRAAEYSIAETREEYKKNEHIELEKWRFSQEKSYLNPAFRIAKWNPYDQNSKAGWFDTNYMFGLSDGFDIVIGNPPYIQLQKNRGHAGKLYQNEDYKTFQRKGDIYQLFYERGFELLKQNGVLAYITSNSWLKAEYGKPLRRWIAECHMPMKLIEMGKGVFENAIVDAAILIARKSEASSIACSAVDVEQAPSGRFPPPKSDWGTLRITGDNPWVTLSKVERSVMEKMEAIGTPLKDWDISIYYGIKTGCNDAFIVNQATRDALVAEDPASEEILKPVLRGRDIAHYRANWAGLYLIDMHNGYEDIPPISIGDYPAIKAHLDKFIGRLRHRQDKGVTPYNLRNCAYHEEFQKPKLLWMHMTPYGRFALVDPDFACNQKCFMITGINLDYLCAALNSSLVTWFVKRIAVTTGMGLIQWDKFVVDRIPIVHPNLLSENRIKDTLRSILSAIVSGNFQDISKYQRTIDFYIFELYGLKEVEIDIVLQDINIL